MLSATSNFQAILECHCPKNGNFYYLLGAVDGHRVRYPSKGAYRVRNPHEPPSAASPGRYLLVFVRYPTDEKTIPHVNAPPGHLVVTLDAAGSAASQAVRAEIPHRKQLAVSTRAQGKASKDRGKQAGDGDSLPEDESLREARSEAAIRNLAIRIKTKEQHLSRTGAVTEDLVDSLHLNQFYRLELKDLQHDGTALSNHHFDTMGRTVGLVGQMQEAFGRQMEINKAQIEKLASPPPPPDYTPAIVAGLNMIRDIGVSFSQHMGQNRRRKKKHRIDAGAITEAALSSAKIDSSERLAVPPAQPSMGHGATAPVAAGVPAPSKSAASDSPPTQQHSTEQRSPPSAPSLVSDASGPNAPCSELPSASDLGVTAPVVPLLKSLGVQSAIVNAVVDTLRAANVSGTSPAKPPPVVAKVPPVAEVNLHAADADSDAAKRRLLDAATADEIAAMLAHLMNGKRDAPGRAK